jgi:hypothetical protein
MNQEKYLAMTGRISKFVRNYQRIWLTTIFLTIFLALELAAVSAADFANFDDATKSKEYCLNDLNWGVKDLPFTQNLFDVQFAPTSVLSPVIGPLRMTTTNQGLSGYWEFNRHMTGYHRPGGGIGGSNDTHAWDVNLYLQGNTNADAGRDVYATANGTVVRFAGVGLPNDCNAVLIAHPNSQNPEWYSGYLHLGSYNVSIGQSVTSSTVIGTVGRACANNDHLHFVVYTGSNSSGGLVSFNTTITERTAGCSINIGQGTSGSQLTAFQNAYNAGGGQSVLGCATAGVRFDGFTSFAGTRSYYQTTANGDIEYHANGSRAGQAFAVPNPFYDKWRSYGFNTNTNFLGYPTGVVSQESTSCQGTRHKYQSFEGGSLVQHTSGSRSGRVYEVHGLIHAKWASGNYAVCPLGLPVSDESPAQPSGATGNRGVLNEFEGGQIYYRWGDSQPYTVQGAIKTKYVSNCNESQAAFHD